VASVVIGFLVLSSVLAVRQAVLVEVDRAVVVVPAEMLVLVICFSAC
jgi:hypothetical protein